MKDKEGRTRRTKRITPGNNTGETKTDKLSEDFDNFSSLANGYNKEDDQGNNKSLFDFKGSGGGSGSGHEQTTEPGQKSNHDEQPPVKEAEKLENDLTENPEEEEEEHER